MRRQVSSAVRFRWRARPSLTPSETTSNTSLLMRHVSRQSLRHSFLSSLRPSESSLWEIRSSCRPLPSLATQSRRAIVDQCLSACLTLASTRPCLRSSSECTPRSVLSHQSSSTEAPLQITPLLESALLPSRLPTYPRYSAAELSSLTSWTPRNNMTTSPSATWKRQTSHELWSTSSHVRAPCREL